MTTIPGGFNPSFGFQAPTAPMPGISLRDLLGGGLAAPPMAPPKLPQPPAFGVDRGGITGTIAGPAAPGMPVGLPSGFGAAEAIGAVAGRLLGKPLDPGLQMQMMMGLAGGASVASTMKSLLQNPMVQVGMAERAMALIAGGKAKGGMAGIAQIDPGAVLKDGGSIAAIKKLQGQFGVPCLCQIPPGALGGPLATPGQPSEAPAGALPRLSTVPANPQWDSVRLTAATVPERVEEALRLAVQMRPDVTARIAKHGDHKDPPFERSVNYEYMTTALAIMRANGIDANRVVRWPEGAVGDPNRYVMDQIRIGDGPAIDIMGGESGQCYIEQGPETARQFLPPHLRNLNE